MRRVRYVIPDNWIRTYLEPRYPELVEPYREAATITLDALRTERLDDADLRTLRAHVVDGPNVLREGAGTMLGKLAAQFPSAARVLEELAGSAKASVRAEALQALLHVPPSALHEQLYAAALRDRSTRIRALAAQGIRQQSLTLLLPQLQQAIAVETNAETERVMRFHDAQLRAGSG